MTEDKKLAIECVMMLSLLAGEYSPKGEQEAQEHSVEVLVKLGVPVDEIAEAMEDMNKNGYTGGL